MGKFILVLFGAVLCLASEACGSADAQHQAAVPPASSASLTSATSESASAAKEFWVMRVTTSNTCRVQESTESPIGERFKGPFSTREAARQEMCRQLDPTLSDTGKCWHTMPANACN